MKQALLLIQRRLFLVTLLSFALTPVIGYSIASFFNMVELKTLFSGTSGLTLIAIYASLLLWCTVHFKNFLQPIIRWKLHHPDDQYLPDAFNAQLQSFGSRYWMFFLLYVLTIPTIHHWFLQSAGEAVSASSLLQFMLLQLTIAILVGLPGYLDGLSTLGKLTRYIGLSSIQMSMRTKMLLVGVYIPLLTTSILLKYYWWQTGFISIAVVLAWALMGLTAILSTIVAYRSLSQSLKPVEMVSQNSGASSHADLAKQLQPHSNDEIGFLVQTLSRLFHRLGEQDQYVQAIVDHAAECIIVINEQQHIEMFNPAAEQLFGFSRDEIKHNNLSWLLPKITFPKAHNDKKVITQEIKTKHRDGRTLTLSVRISQMKMNNKIFYILLVGDITEQKAYELELTYQTQHDKLTGLYNRNFFQQELEHTISRLRRNEENCALIYLDLDHFKYVNDTIGHAAGDKLLIEVSQLLKDKLREGDLLARFGGDEFTILLFDTDDHAIDIVAHNLLGFFESYRFYSENQLFNVTCSMGITHLNRQTESADLALSHADIACNIAKTEGRNCFHIYDPANKQLDGMAEDMGWAGRVKDAYENDNFSLVYQPIVSIEDGSVNNFEVLLRMNLDDGQHILPGGFIPAAERFGLINNVDRWTVSRSMRALIKLHEHNNKICFSINLSGRAFEDDELLPMIQGILDNTGLDPTSLTFEITETAAIANISAAKIFISKLKDMGCQFALDDFGTGFCSFAYLKNLAVDKLKIDGSFVQNLDKSNVDQAMVQSMNQIAHALGKQTVAEFVQNEKTLILLKEYGVDFAQGHYLGKPLDIINTSNIIIASQPDNIIYN